MSNVSISCLEQITFYLDHDDTCFLHVLDQHVALLYFYCTISLKQQSACRYVASLTFYSGSGEPTNSY